MGVIGLGNRVGSLLQTIIVGAPQAILDFTRGKWINRSRLCVADIAE